MEWLVDTPYPRLDTALKGQFPSYSRTFIQEALASGEILVNGKPAKKRLALAPGDRVTLALKERPSLTCTPEAIDLPILYEDEHIVVIDKPAGIATHPAPGSPSGTVANALCDRLRGGNDPLRPGIVHRLDKDTTGVLIAAKSEMAYSRLVEAFSARQIEKTYLAITVGNPGQVSVNLPIGRHPKQRKKMAVIEGGKEAITHIEPIRWTHELALVKIFLETGRTHQIRVHLAHLGTPVLGDPLYGVNHHHKVPHQQLHAARLRLAHPITGEPLDLSSEPKFTCI